MINKITRNAIKISASLKISDDAAVKTADIKNDTNVIVSAQAIFFPLEPATAVDLNRTFLSSAGCL
jgi:hypothetical protein